MGQVVIAGPNTATYPMDPNDTTAIMAWMAGAAAAAALNKTETTYQDYLNEQFSSWLTNYEAGRAVEPPPGVPLGWNAEMSDDGFSYVLVPSTVPAGPSPTYTKLNVAPSTGIAAAKPPTGILFGQIGVPITQQDGTVWVRLK